MFNETHRRERMRHVLAFLSLSIFVFSGWFWRCAHTATVKIISIQCAVHETLIFPLHQHTSRPTSSMVYLVVFMEFLFDLIAIICSCRYSCSHVLMCTRQNRSTNISLLLHKHIHKKHGIVISYNGIFCSQWVSVCSFAHLLHRKKKKKKKIWLSLTTNHAYIAAAAASWL